MQRFGFVSHDNQFEGWMIVDVCHVLGFVGGQPPPSFSFLQSFVSCVL